MLSELAQDARYTLRLWQRRPWHTALAILPLAIGIGANTGVFSVVEALLLRSLPFRDADRLVSLREFYPPHDSAAQFHQWRRSSAYLADAALTEQADVNLGNASSLSRAHAAQVSSNFFHLLGTRPVLGRAFLPGEDDQGRDHVTVIGYGLWQQLFAGDSRAVGSALRVGGDEFTIVGIAPPRFDYPGKSVLWMPARFRRGNNAWYAIARLKPGITWPQARAAFSADAQRFGPDRNASKLVKPPAIVSLRDELAGEAKSGSLMLMAAVAIILLIACANVANLLAARSAARAREISIRSALGATRARLVRQLIAECLLLGFAASAVGSLVAFWTISIAREFQPAPMEPYSIFDARVLGFAIAAAIVTALVFGAGPSLAATRLGIASARRPARGGLVAVQVMLTIMLLAASISVGRAFLDLIRLDRGFDFAGVVTVSVSLDGTSIKDDARLAYFEEALARVRRLPGVRSASATEFLPLNSPGALGAPFSFDGRPASGYLQIVPVFSDYFETMGGRILYGREFNDAEIRADAPVAIVDERFAAQFGSPADAVGHSISEGRAPALKIIGVARAMAYQAEASAGQNQVFVPAHSPGNFYSTFIARSDHPGVRLAMVRDAVRSVDPHVPVFGVKTMQQRLDEALARPQFYRTAIACFAAFALLLAAIGTYGTVSVTVARRTHEIGVRMALGTTPARLRLDLLGQNLLTIAAGAIPGVVGALLTGRLLPSLIAGAQPSGAITCTASAAFLASVAAAGIWIATSPIAKLDVMEILRAD